MPSEETILYESDHYSFEANLIYEYNAVATVYV